MAALNVESVPGVANLTKFDTLRHPEVDVTEAGIGTTRYLILTMTLPLVRPFST